MAGNVSEWVSDWYSENYYENSPSEDPEGPESGTRRVLKNGSWMSWGDGEHLFTYSRGSCAPIAGESRVGFRSAE
jgi:formylglycine-generating enzyme required for sulfatase activity